MEVQDLEKKAAWIRHNALTTIQKSGMSGTGSSMSSVEILTTLYYGTLNRKPVAMFDPAKPGWAEQDYIVLGKGAATAVQYSILADLGFFDQSELDHYSQVNSLLQSRPVSKIPGIVAPAVSSGHTLSIVSGIAMGVKMDRAANKVFAVIDVSDLQNGQVLEAATSAAHYNLDNLILFIDDAEFQADGTVRAVMDTGFIQAKLDSFGWRVIRVPDGNDFDDLLNALLKTYTMSRRPICIWCSTVSGKGIDFAERKHGYFNAPLSEPELDLISSKLKKLYGSD